MPEAFRQAEPEKADRYMQALNKRFWRARNPVTGLIPYEVPPQKTFYYDASPGAGMQPVWQLERAIRFLKWFPDDPKIMADTKSLADATIRYFSYSDPESGKPLGIWSHVDVATGQPEGPLYRIRS